METPASLLERLRRPGDPVAWARFVELYTPLLFYSPALAQLQEADQAEDWEQAEYRRHLVQHALEVLRPEIPHSTWQAFHQYVTVGRPAEQVAAELGLRVGTVYAAKSRVLRRLRQELQGLLD